MVTGANPMIMSVKRLPLQNDRRTVCMDRRGSLGEMKRGLRAVQQARPTTASMFLQTLAPLRLNAVGRIGAPQEIHPPLRGYLCFDSHNGSAAARRGSGCIKQLSTKQAPWGGEHKGYVTFWQSQKHISTSKIHAV